MVTNLARAEMMATTFFLFCFVVCFSIQLAAMPLRSNDCAKKI